MKRIYLICCVIITCNLCHAQSFIEEIEAYRNHYIAEHLLEERSPIKYPQVKYLDFYAPNEYLKILASVELVQDSIGFTMLTHSGKKQHYFQYAALHFKVNGKKRTLFLYQNKRLMNSKEHKNHLFLPFNDATNYFTTFAGGRYIDFEISDIKDNSLQLDFNKAYNPYCAYAGGFNCPIPPKENRLDIAIKAGEKSYLGVVSEH